MIKSDKGEMWKSVLSVFHSRYESPVSRLQNKTKQNRSHCASVPCVDKVWFFFVKEAMKMKLFFTYNCGEGAFQYMRNRVAFFCAKGVRSQCSACYFIKVNYSYVAVLPLASI